MNETQHRGRRPLKVALLGCGVGRARRWCGCCTSRPTTWPPGSARRSSWSASPYAASDARARRRGARRAAHHRRRGPGRARRRRPRRRGDRRHRAGPVADPRRAGERRVAWSPPTRRCSPRTAPTLFDGGREGRPRPLLRGRRRRRDPDPAAAARVARRRPGHAGCSASSTAPPTSSSTRWTPPAPASPRRSRRPRSSATPRPTRPPTSRASTPRPRPRSSPASPSTPGSPPPTCYREGITEVTAADVAVGPRDGLRGQAARDLRAARRPRRTGRLGARAPGDDPAVAPAGQRPRGLQRGLRRVPRPPAS